MDMRLRVCRERQVDSLLELALRTPFSIESSGKPVLDKRTRGHGNGKEQCTRKDGLSL